MEVGAFLLSQPVGEPWNCSTEPSDWCVALGHPDFAAPWRHIVDPHDCDAVAGGDLLSLWRMGIGDGLPNAPEPYAPGDIAVVEVLGFQAGAIWTGDSWAIRTKRGRHFISTHALRVRQAWRP